MLNRMRLKRLKMLFGLMLVGLSISAAFAAERFIVLASTTSTENSGLFTYILPKFSEKTGIAVQVVAVGTGQAVKMAQRGDADVLLAHHKPSEQRFVQAGGGVARFNVMYNDFVLVGPQNDPAAVRGMADAIAALRKVSQEKALFVSRGDDSGTHQRELALWGAAGVDAQAASGAWYRESGSGMGATLNIASGLGAYTLTDRATWISFANKGPLEILLEGDPLLFNQYGVILVSPTKHPHIKAREGQAFIDWLTSDEGQSAIASFRLAGQQMFFPNAQQ